MEMTVRTELYAFQAIRQVFFEVCYHLITPDIYKGNLNTRIYREVTGEMWPLFLISGVAALAVLYPTVERIATAQITAQHTFILIPGTPFGNICMYSTANKSLYRNYAWSAFVLLHLLDSMAYRMWICECENRKGKE